MTPIFQGLFGFSEEGNKREERSAKTSAGYAQSRREKEIEPSTGEKSKEEEDKSKKGQRGHKGANRSAGKGSPKMGRGSRDEANERGGAKLLLKRALDRYAVLA